MAERNQGISFDAIFGAFSDVQTPPLDLVITAGMLPTIVETAQPVIVQPPTQSPKYPQYAPGYTPEPMPHIDKPVLKIPEVQLLLPGQTNYRLITKADGTQFIEDHDIGDYPFLRELMKTRKKYLDMPAVDIVVPQFVAQPCPVTSTVASQEYVAPPKPKKSFSEKFDSFKFGMSRAAKLSRMAGAMTVAGVVLVGSYQLGGGPSLREEGLLAVPKTAVENLSIAVTDPGRTIGAQLTRIHLWKFW